MTLDVGAAFLIWFIWRLVTNKEKELTKKINLTDVGLTVRHTGGELSVLEGVDFHAFQDEIVTVIGPSGCGKSTLLNIIAGLHDPDRGEVIVSVDGIDRTDASCRLGSIGYMQQKDLLLPWRSLIGNVILGLEIRGVGRKEARLEAAAQMADFGLEGFENEFPYALSGGMRQRAAFLRTMLMETDVLLLDEPFSALDALNRAHLQTWLLDILRGKKKTTVLVTHDVDEAIFLSDRVCVMSPRPGRIYEVEHIPFERPRSRNLLTDPVYAEVKSRLLGYLIGSRSLTEIR